MKFNFPIELGETFRRYTIENFKELKFYFDNLKQLLKEHQTTDEHVHNAKQIDYVTDYSNNVSQALDKQDKRIKNLVIGANGDAMAEVKDSRVTVDGDIKDLLSERLDTDFGKIKNEMEANYKVLNTKIERIINVNDYGADPTGQTDSTQAFEKAFANGNVHVHMTAGDYIIRGLKLPNNTILSGEGKNITRLKIADDAPAETIGITNLLMEGLAENIGIESFSIDGNKLRQNGVLKPTGGSRSSNIRFAGVKKGYIKDIYSFDSLLHTIDVTYANDDYFYGGDGVRVNESLESRFIHIDDCEVTGFGDDGITTHHSSYILVTNNYSHDPTKDSGNHNGIEYDDGSRHIFSANNKTENCFGGLEIKAHGTSSAASDAVVVSHLDIGSIRSYNFRHIGHHRVATDTKSKTARNIIAGNLVSLRPHENGSYEGATSRALVVAAYTGVIIDKFTAIGDGSSTPNEPVVAIQFMAENVTLNNITITGFKNASSDIKVYGGANKPKNITLSNINIFDSSNNIGIAGGAGVYDLKIIGATLKGNGTGNGLELYNNTTQIVGVTAEGYTNSAKIGTKAYTIIPTVLKGGFSAGASGSGAVAPSSAVIASSGGSFANNNRSYVIGSGAGSIANGSRSSVANSLNSRTTEGGHTQMVTNSKNVLNNMNYHWVGGYAEDSKDPSKPTVPSTSAIKVDFSMFSGNARFAGQVQSGQNFGDYAEYYESQSGQPIPLGTIVTLDGRMIRKAQTNDLPLGVISGTAGVVLGDQMFHHKDKFLKNEFGVTVTERIKKEWKDDKGKVYSEYVDMPVKNPDFDESYDEEEYLSRAERPEWNIVGLVGQVFTRIDDTVTVNDYIKPINGIGTKDNVTGFYRVLAVTTPYSQEKGYGVAVVQVVPLTLANKGSVK